MEFKLQIAEKTPLNLDMDKTSRNRSVLSNLPSLHRSMMGPMQSLCSAAIVDESNTDHDITMGTIGNSDEIVASTSLK